MLTETDRRLDREPGVHMQQKTFADVEFEKPPEPYWIASTKPTRYHALEKDIKVDVAIVGGGIVGVTAAYLLKCENLTVAILEGDRIVQGATGHTTAKITSQHDLVYSKLIKHLGMDRARQYAEANQSAIDFIENLITEKKIDCDFSRQPAYLYTLSDQYVQQIQSEVDAAISLGIKAEYLEHLPLPMKIKACERFDNQAQFHPRKYLLALAKEVPGRGSHIFEQTRAVDFHEDRPCTVITAEGHRVTAEQVIIATHFPVYGSNGYYFARMYAERSYVLGIRIDGEFPGGMYITAEQPGRSLRCTPSDRGELILVGGEHHKTGQGPNTNTHYQNLIEFAKDMFEVAEIPFRWSTQDYTTLDDIPYAGRITSSSANVNVATGFRKWGMTNGTASAILLRDLIVKGESPWASVYDPSRFEGDPMIKNLAKINFDMAKHLVGDKLKSIPTDTNLEPGEARIVSHDGDKIGVFRDKKGKTHAVDVTCTHMGCDLAWNAAELSWDCPCHGSRFTYEGEIIEGPSLRTLRTTSGRFNP